MAVYKDVVGKSGYRPSPEYVKLLERIFLASMCDKRALYDGQTTKANMRILINKAMENGHITKSSYKEVYGQRNRKHDVYSITAKGVACLSFFGTKPWCSFLPSSPDYPLVRKDRRNPTLAYESRCGDALLVMDALGATYSEFLLSGKPADTSRLIPTTRVMEEDEEEEDEVYNLASDDYEAALYDIGVMEDPDEGDGDGSGETTLTKIKRDAYATMQLSTETTQEDIEEGNLYFFPIREIREMFLQNNVRNMGTFDFNYCRSVGALFSEKVGLVLYHAKHDGLVWVRGAGHRDLKIMQRFSGRFSPFDTIVKGRAFAGVLVYNEKNFSDIVTNKFKRRKLGGELGKDYDIMHTIPLSMYGPEFLARWVLPLTASERRSYIQKEIAELYELHYVADVEVRRNITYEGEMGLVADGTNLDIIQAVNQYKMYCDGLLDKLTIICFPWQETFYERLWSNIITLQFISAEYPEFEAPRSGESQS